MVKKVKCTLVQALRLCTGRTAHRGSRGIVLLFLDYGTRRGWGVSLTPRPLFTPGKDPAPIVQEAGWAHRAGLDRCGKSRPNGIRSPDRPGRSQSDVMDSVTNTSYLFLVRIHKAEFRGGLRHFIIYKRLLELWHYADCSWINAWLE